MYAQQQIDPPQQVNPQQQIISQEQVQPPIQTPIKPQQEAQVYINPKGNQPGGIQMG